MILSGHQPNFLPYLGFFDKMMKCEFFILVDHIQFEKKGWQNRNRVRVKHGSDGWAWLTVPVYTSSRYEQTISEVEIDNSSEWGDKIWKTLFYSYKKADFFEDHEDFLKSVFTECRWEKLVDLNIELIKYLKECFDIEVPIIKSSDYSFSGKKTDLLIEMTKKLGCDTYLSGGSDDAREYVCEEEFEKHGLNHVFQNFIHPTYKQLYKPFVPNMSALDLLLNHGDESKEILKQGK